MRMRSMLAVLVLAAASPLAACDSGRGSDADVDSDLDTDLDTDTDTDTDADTDTDTDADSDSDACRLDQDLDGHVTGADCEQVPRDQQDCDDSNPAVWTLAEDHAACARACTDADGDDLFVDCDAYDAPGSLGEDADDGRYELLIAVSSSIASAIEEPLTQHRRDLLDEGAQSRVLIRSGGDIASLKLALREQHEQFGIEGALLVGTLPAAWYEMSSDFGPWGIFEEEFPCDLYLADLDQGWEDTDENGMLDTHPDFAADTNGRLELFVSRLPGDAVQVGAYLDRAHEFRQNGSGLSRTAVCFIDDDWHDPAYRVIDQTWRLDELYSGVNHYQTVEDTDKDDYLQIVTDPGAEFIYQVIHSDQARLDIYEGDQRTFLTAQDLMEEDLRTGFHILNNCSGSKFTDTCIAHAYLFSDSGLATLGTTKVGGVIYPTWFTGPLLEGKSWGEAFRQWFEDDGFSDEAWFLGIVILGDPMLRLTDDTALALQRRASETPGPSVELRRKLLLRLFLQGRGSTRGGFAEYRARHPEFFR